MVRRYIVPMSSADICLAEWMIDLRRFGVDTLFLTSAVLHAILTNDANPYVRVIAYINHALNQLYERDLNLLGSAIAARAYEEDIDRLSLICIEVCNVIQPHLTRYVALIEAQEAENGADVTKMWWAVHGYVGEDIVIEVGDEKEMGDGNGGA